MTKTMDVYDFINEMKNSQFRHFYNIEALREIFAWYENNEPEFLFNCETVGNTFQQFETIEDYLRAYDEDISQWSECDYLIAKLSNGEGVISKH